MSLALLHSSKGKFARRASQARISVTKALTPLPVDPRNPPDPTDVYGNAERNKQLEQQEKIIKSITSVCLSFFCTFCYLWGIVNAARVSVYWEIVIIFVFPAAGFLFGWQRWTSKRQRELIMLESTYNMFVVITKLLILYNNSVGSEVMSYLFLAFFFLQVAGFVKHQAKERQWAGLIMSLTMAVSIALQRWEMRELGYNPQTANLYCNKDVVKTLSPYAYAVYKKNCIGGFHGQFLMWGMEAGPMMKLNYLFWVSNVLLVDYAKFLPALIIPVVHYASVVMSFYSTEFWHVRLITASHLFVLDGIALYKFGVISKDFCEMVKSLVPFWQTTMVPLFAFICLMLCITCPIIAGVCGQQSLYCWDDDTGAWMGVGSNGTLYRDYFNSTLDIHL